MALVGSAAGRRLRASRQCAALLPPPAAALLPPVLTSRPTCLPALPRSWSSRNGWWRALCGAPLSPRRSWMRCQRMWAPTAPSARRECRPLLCSSVQWGVCLLPLAVVVCAGCVLVADPIAGSSAGSPLSRPLSFPTLPPSPLPCPPCPPCPALPCSYFLQPKASIMGHLEEAVKASDAELKKVSASREALAKSQESLRKELTELITALRRS